MTRGPLMTWMAAALLLVPVTASCARFLDVPVALFVKEPLYANPHWSRYTSDMPDLLLQTVVATTVLAFLLYTGRVRRGIFDTYSSFLRLVIWVAPVSYLVKGALKVVFGRTNTRVWLSDRSLYGFHFFHGGRGFDGFPSGHMMVVGALLAAVWRFYPRCRPFCALAAAGLAAALVATDYHFVSDVIVGGYVAAATEAVVFHLLLRWPVRPRG